MAPEVMSNSEHSSYSSKSDCWSLGIILYQLLSGLHPYTDGGQMEGIFLLHVMPAILIRYSRREVGGNHR